MSISRKSWAASDGSLNTGNLWRDREFPMKMVFETIRYFNDYYEIKRTENRVP